MSSSQTHVSPADLEATPPLAPPKRSAVEGIKEESRQLRGRIKEELSNEADHFSDQDKQLLKFHGTYQQEDRDARKLRRKEGIGKHHMFMVRCKIPGGRLTANRRTLSPALPSKPTLSRFTARFIYRESSRPGWLCRRTTASTFTRRTLDCSPSSRMASLSATTCLSAAAWG